MYNTVENILKYITFEVTVFLTIFLRSRSKGILSFNAQGACLSGGASHPLRGHPVPGSRAPTDCPGAPSRGPEHPALTRPGGELLVPLLPDSYLPGQ